MREKVGSILVLGQHRSEVNTAINRDITAIHISSLACTATPLHQRHEDNIAQHS